MFSKRKFLKRVFAKVQMEVRILLNALKYYFGSTKFKGFEREEIGRLEQGIDFIQSAESFVFWLDSMDMLLNINVKSASLLLNYLNDRDYGLAILKNQLVLVDMADITDQIREISMDELIDMACDWNYEDLINSKEHIGYYFKRSQFIMFLREVLFFKAAERDKKILLNLYKKTIYYNFPSSAVEFDLFPVNRYGCRYSKE